MYASVRHYTLTRPDVVDEVSRRVQQGFVPIVSGVAGFQSYYLVDQGNGEVVSVSVFADRQGAEESTRQAASWVKDNLAQFMQGTAQVTEGEVTVHA